MKRLIFTLLLTAATAVAIAKPDTLDYRCDYYFAKRTQQESIPVQPCNVVMLGNSLTERGAWNEYFQQSLILNRGIGGDCVAGMIARADAIAAGHPRAIFLMAGINDLIFSTITPEALCGQYERLLDKIRTASPSTQVFVQSLLPLDEKQNEPYFKGQNARIEVFNTLLREAAARHRLVWIDLRSRIACNGSLPEEYTVDGIHLNAAGYAVWTETLRPYMPSDDLRRGSVTCNGEGVPGVVVSDGEHCTATDSLGRYSLPYTQEARFVWISTPAGYASPSEEGVVRFFLPVTEERSSYDFTLQRKPSDETRHGFVVIADPQVFARKEFRLLEGSAQDIRQTVKASPVPFHGICVGDITSGEHDFYTQYNDIMGAAGIQFRNSMGNHDMKIWGRSYETSLRPYEAMYGPCCYSYNVGKIHYVVLNDNFFIGRDWYYIGYLEERQLAWLEEDLGYVRPGSTVVVALHIPTMYKDKQTLPFDYKTSERSLCNYRALYELLKPYNTHIVSGHMHTTTNSDIRKGLYEHNIAALSGAWWQGTICTDGTPAGYGVFLADGDRITWRYKSVGQADDFQVKVYDETDDPAFAGRIVANVWNCDDTWTVEMRADGGKPVTMERTTAVDPQARALYADTSKLDHKWITVIPSDHYYTAPLPAGTKRIEVTARDRFGNAYRAEKKIKRTAK